MSCVQFLKRESCIHSLWILQSFLNAADQTVLWQQDNESSVQFTSLRHAAGQRKLCATRSLSHWKDSKHHMGPVSLIFSVIHWTEADCSQLPVHSVQSAGDGALPNHALPGASATEPTTLRGHLLLEHSLIH